MMMILNEFLPIAGGLLIGSILNIVPNPYKWFAGVLMVLLWGFFAAFVSGELQLSSAFLLFDIPLVCISAVVGYSTVYFGKKFFAKTI